jgi:hypothetical protein
MTGVNNIAYGKATPSMSLTDDFQYTRHEFRFFEVLFIIIYKGRVLGFRTSIE